MNPTAFFPLAGRILIASLFLVAGVRKALAFGGTAAYLAKLGLPAPEAMVVLSILLELACGILLIIGWRTRWVAWLLALFVVIATFTAHRFWEFDAAQLNNQLNHFLKNAAIVGGQLMIAFFGPGPAAADRT